PACFLQPLQKRRETRLSFRVVRGKIHEHADAAHPLALLRARRERPRRSRATKKRDELAASHVGHGPSSCRGVTTSNRVCPAYRGWPASPWGRLSIFKWPSPTMPSQRCRNNGARSCSRLKSIAAPALACGREGLKPSREPLPLRYMLRTIITNCERRAPF